MNPVQADGVNRRRGPGACFESRTSTRSGFRAISTQPLPSSPLAVLLRQTVLGTGDSWLCSTLAPFGLNQPRMSPRQSG